MNDFNFDGLIAKPKGNLEIEHKFLIKDLATVKKLPKIHSKKIEQGYLSRKPTVRVRIIGMHAFITIKGKGCRVRQEFEYRIPMADAKKLMKLCGDKKITKIRHYYGPWEIDEFKGRHKGLWMAEIELKTPKSKLPALPDWLGREVTNSPQYTNASLANR